MADGSFSIRKACKIVFKDPILLMCRYHMHKNLNQYYSKKEFLPDFQIKLKKDTLFKDYFDKD